MRITLTDGGATIEAQDLGPLLGIEPALVPIKMRSGEITSQSEEGTGEDLGNHRLTFWYNGKRGRLVCNSEGKVLKTTRSVAPKRPV